jgi:polysaccharide pyruvyl transferase WcaK-like protein
MNKMKRVLISTKLKTTNIGNQALSDELIKLASDYTNKCDFIVEGRPFGLDKYTFDYFDKNDPIAEFEKIAQKIAGEAMKFPKQNAFKSDLNKVRTNLLDVEGSVVKTESLRRVARKFRKFYYSFFLFSSAYKKRLQLYNSVDYYLYSGAGEISNGDFFLRQLLDLRIAQIMGVKVCAINQSVEIDANIESKLLNYVYSKMYKIVVRGNLSLELLIKGGIDKNNIVVCPDTAFRNKFNFITKEKFSKNIAINLTPKKYDKEKYEGLISKLIQSNYKITFVSNEPMGEKSLATELKEKFKIETAIQTLDYPSYSKFINQFDFLISTRLHSNELAITAGVPVIPIEGNIFKTQEVFKFVNYPIEVLKINDKNFLDKIWSNVEYVENNFQEIQSWISNNIEKISCDSAKNISSIIEN